MLFTVDLSKKAIKGRKGIFVAVEIGCIPFLYSFIESERVDICLEILELSGIWMTGSRPSSEFQRAIMFSRRLLIF